ncbi:MAG: methyltransferase [Lentisphaerae bacterium]|nr:methyltransferase [Lentisphaerota bacterium]
MKSDKDLYRQLRELPCEKLWGEEVARFEQASPRERMERVAVIRAVGVVFSRFGTGAQKREVRAWLGKLLQDPCEKIRRYAMAALPKIGADAQAESELLGLLGATTEAREKKFVGRALEKIGGTATLDAAARVPDLLPQTEQKIKARVARQEKPSTVRLDATLEMIDRLRIHLRCRKGLETILRDEVEEKLLRRGRFQIVTVRRGLVVISPLTAFTLRDLYALRCFATLGFVLGTVPGEDPAGCVDALAAAMTSPLVRIIMTTLTEGSLRYRLDFVSHGHQRGAVRLVANRAYARCPDILNDPRSAPWAIDIHPAGGNLSVELRPKLVPDPRLAYRQDDIPAASHPPLAACMARLAGRADHERVWDPFCGSGLELIERALLGGVEQLIGTDVSAEAIAIAQANVAAAKIGSVQTTFACCDFRSHATVEGLGPQSLSLIISNPPMGRRIRVPNLRGLFEDLFAVAAVVLRPGGRLVFANPLKIEPRDASLLLQSRQVIDLGGFDCRLEVYRKAARDR